MINERPFRKVVSYDVAEVVPYVNWLYFYHAWQVGPGKEREVLRQDADRMLRVMEGRYHTHAVFALMDAYSEGDDIMVQGNRLPMLRQQRPDTKGYCLCLADFVRKRSDKMADTVGLFATTVDTAMESDFRKDPYEQMMAQTLADRLAEATAERMHREVRTCYWGYAPDEDLSIEQLHAEAFMGIRPAVGYPSMPDTSVNFLIQRLLDMAEIGIQLTESGAMRPHASVSGLMIAHPEAHYFTVGEIDEAQLADYAQRRGLTAAVMRRFLSANLQNQ